MLGAVLTCQAVGHVDRLYTLGTMIGHCQRNGDGFASLDKLLFYISHSCCITLDGTTSQFHLNECAASETFSNIEPLQETIGSMEIETTLVHLVGDSDRLGVFHTVCVIDGQ